MKLYIRFLDMVTLCLIILAVTFQLKDNVIIESHTNRVGMVRTLIISWQSLMMVAGFCVFLRYVAQNVVEKEA